MNNPILSWSGGELDGTLQNVVWDVVGANLGGRVNAHMAGVMSWRPPVCALNAVHLPRETSKRPSESLKS